MSVKYVLEYLPVAVLDAVLTRLPERTAVAFGEKLGVALSWILPRRNRLVVANLERAFPEKTPDEVRRVARGVWKNVGRTAAEFLRAPLVRKDQIGFKGVDVLEAARAEGKGVVLATMHFGNWEWAAIATGMVCRDATAIARPIKNPFVNRWVLKKRSVSGVGIIYHRQAVRASLKTMKANGVVAILMDQNLYQGGVFVDFFGRPAATTTLPALIHVRTGAPVVLAYLEHTPAGPVMAFEGPIRATEGETQDDRIARLTQDLTTRIEEVIRRRPEQWFWVHDRWKRSAEARDGVSVPEVP